MRCVTAYRDMNSHYMPVKHLGNSHLSEALMFEKLTWLKIVNFIYIYFVAAHEKCNGLLGDEQPIYACKMSGQLSAERSLDIWKMTWLKNVNFIYIYFMAAHEKSNSLLGDEQPLYTCKMSGQLAAERSFDIWENDIIEDCEFHLYILHSRTWEVQQSPRRWTAIISL